MYQKIFLTGKLAEHRGALDKTTFECSDKIQAACLEANPMPLEDMLARIRLLTQAQVISDEIVLAELIYP